MSHQSSSRRQQAGTSADSGFLQRGGGAGGPLPKVNSSPPPQLPMGPSVVLDEATGAATAVPIVPSLPASQLFSQVGGAAAASALSRQRPRFQTVQDLDLALHEAIEGRINTKNAWVSKEASNLLEGITHTIESTLDANTTDDYSGFTKAATVVEGCSKVWTVRVDSTYQQSNQMLQRLLRNDDTPAAESSADGGEGDDGDALDGARRRNQRERAAAAAAAAAVRTLALNASEINLDSKAKTSLTQTGINAQFRAITEKFDQGNAQGLLLSNAPLGAKGNVILDVDYARVEGEFSARRARKAQRLAEAAEDSGVAAEGGSSAEVSARPSRHSVALDAEVNAVLDDLPVFPCGYGGVGEAEESDSGSRAGGGSRSGVGSGRVSGAVVDDLLLLSHAVLKAELVAEGEGPGGSALSGSTAFAGGDGGLEPHPLVPHGGRDEDEDDMGSPGDWGEWNDDDVDDGDDDGGPAEGGAQAMADVDVGEEARHLVSGVAEMDAVDACFSARAGSGGARGEGSGAGDRRSSAQQLALEAEDPSAWCPLVELASGPLAGVAPNSELSRLRRQHRLTSASAAPATAAATVGAAGSGAEGVAGTGGSTAAKRARKEKTVVFDLSEVHDLDASAATITSSTLFALGQADASSSALKQSTTAGKNMTPLGKEILLGKEAGQRVLAYTQSSFQRAAAEQANLLLPTDPVPGESIPAYLAFPITMNGFFQPFSTPHASWNLLRKSATGHLEGSASVSHRGTAGGAVAGGMGGAAVDPSGAEPMPVASFPAGAEVDEVVGDDHDNGYGIDYYGEDVDGSDGGGGGDGDADDAYMRAELQLLRQFDAQQQQQQQQQQDTAAASARDSGEQRTHVEAADLLRALQSSEAVLPTQVDVVRLRASMWAVLQELAAITVDGDGQAGAGTAARAVPDEEERGPSDAENVEGTRQPMEAASALKAGALRLLASSARATRAKTGGGGGAAPEGTATAQGAAAVSHGGAARKRPRTGADPSSPAPSSAEESGGDEEGGRAVGGLGECGGAEGALCFSNVVEALLPQVSAISSTGSLSPAFFFFSILFLANEHNIVLDNVASLDDLTIDVDSLVRGGGGTIVRVEGAKRRRTAKGQVASARA